MQLFSKTIALGVLFRSFFCIVFLQMCYSNNRLPQMHFFQQKTLIDSNLRIPGNFVPYQHRACVLAWLPLCTGQLFFCWNNYFLEVLDPKIIHKNTLISAKRGCYSPWYSGFVVCNGVDNLIVLVLVLHSIRVLATKCPRPCNSFSSQFVCRCGHCPALFISLCAIAAERNRTPRPPRNKPHFLLPSMLLPDKFCACQRFTVTCLPHDCNGCICDEIPMDSLKVYAAAQFFCCCCMVPNY